MISLIKYEDDKFVGKTFDDSFVRIDFAHQTISEKYIPLKTREKNPAEDKLGLNAFALRVQDKKIGMISNENKFLSFGYVAINYTPEKNSFDVKKLNHDNKKWYFGVMNKYGDVICPAVFENIVYSFVPLTITMPAVFHARSLSQEAIVKDEKVILSGTNINVVMDKLKYQSAKKKAEDDGLPKKASIVSVFDEKTNTSTLYGLDNDNFVENSKIKGQVTSCHLTTKNNVLYVVAVPGEYIYEEDYYLVDWTGKMNVHYDHIERELNDGNGLAGVYIAEEDNDFIKIENEEKVGIVDVKNGKVLLAAKFPKVMPYSKREDGTYAFVVGTEHDNYGVVDGTGKPMIPLKYKYVESKTIKFDGEDRVVSLLKSETKDGSNNIYVDPSNETCLATALEVDRFRDVPSARAGRYPKKKIDTTEENNEYQPE